MISVPYISSFQRRFITKAIREKYKRTKRYRQYCIQKIPFIGEKSRWSMLLSWYSRSSIWHASIAPIAFRTWFGNFSDMMEKTHNNRKQESRQYTKDKTKKTTCRQTLVRKLTSSFWGDPCRTACFVGLTTRSSVAAGELVVSQTPRERRPEV